MANRLVEAVKELFTAIDFEDFFKDLLKIDHWGVIILVYRVLPREQVYIWIEPVFGFKSYFTNHKAR